VILVVAAAAGYFLLAPPAPGGGASSSSGASGITVNIAASPLCKSTQTITIGELNDLSGGLSTEGIPIKAAMAIAITDINKAVTAAGCTVKFAVDVFDYGLDNQKALTQMNTWSSQGVVVVVGPLNSGTAQFLLSYAQSNHIVLISPSSTSPALVIQNRHFLYRSAPNDAAQGLAAGKILVDRGYKAAIIINRHDTYGDGLANATAARFTVLGGKVVDTIPYDTSTTDFTAILTKLNTDYQSAVSTYGAGKVAIYDVAFQEAGTMLIQAQTSFPNLLGTTWFGSDGEATLSQFVNGTAVTSASAKVKLVSTLFAPQNNTRTLAFLQVFAAQAHETCSFYCLAGYDDTWIAAFSVLQAGKNDGAAVDAVLPGVAAGLNGVSGGISGDNALQASGDRVPGSYQIWKVATDSSGKGTWVNVGTWDYNADKVTWSQGQP
jgi:branched-chain amino acid transport system substrate-binding protein